MRGRGWRWRVLGVALLALGLGTLGMVAANALYARHADARLDRLVVRPRTALPADQLPPEWRAAQTGNMAGLSQAPAPSGAMFASVSRTRTPLRPSGDEVPMGEPPAVPVPVATPFAPPPAGPSPEASGPPGTVPGPALEAAVHEVSQVAGPPRPLARWVDWNTLSRTLGVLPAPTRVAIPAIGLDAPVVEVAIAWDGDQRAWQRAKDSVGHHAGTANPGELGNMVLSGHISSPVRGEGSIFKHLPEVAGLMELGEAVDVHVSTEGLTYIYRLVESVVVEPDDLSVFSPTEEPSITLITCVPDFVYSHRLVIRGLLIKVMDGGAPSRGQTANRLVVEPV